jgi:hypothetical protein
LVELDLLVAIREQALLMVQVLATEQAELE